MVQFGVNFGWGRVGVCCDLFGWKGGYDCIDMPVSCEVAGAVVGCVEMLRDMGLTRPGPGLWREEKRKSELLGMVRESAGIANGSLYCAIQASSCFVRHGEVYRVEGPWFGRQHLRVCKTSTVNESEAFYD